MRCAAKLAAAAERLKSDSGMSAAPFSLAFMTDRHRIDNPLAIVEALPARAAVILRDYDLPARAALARQLRRVTEARDVFLLIGGDAALAEAVKADGVHAPSTMNPDRSSTAGVLTAACHNEAELRRARACKVDIAFLSPVFPTGSHPDAPTLGAEEFRRLARETNLPIIALGGVNAENASELAGPNVVGIAAISAFKGD